MRKRRASKETRCVLQKLEKDKGQRYACVASLVETKGAGVRD